MRSEKFNDTLAEHGRSRDDSSGRTIIHPCFEPLRLLLVCCDDVADCTFLRESYMHGYDLIDSRIAKNA